MKVNVLQADDVEFGKFRFYSNWIDVCIYQYDSTVYLVQMKISRFNGKKFRSVKVTSSFHVAKMSDVGDLTAMKGELR